MKIVPSGQALGATVEGLDLSQKLPEETVEELIQALGRYGVLRFPEQDLTARSCAISPRASASSRSTSPTPTRSPACRR